MKIADQIKNRVLSLPEKAFFLIDIDNRPQTLFIDQMNDDDWNNLYKEISSYYADEDSGHISMHRCFNKNDERSKRFQITSCFCTKTNTWHMPYDLDAACRKGGNE